MNRRVLSASAIVRCLALFAATIFLSCSVKTEYVKLSFAKAIQRKRSQDQHETPMVEVPRLFTQTCLDSGQVRRLIKCDPEFQAIRKVNTSAIPVQFQDYHVSCPGRADQAQQPMASDPINCIDENVTTIPRIQEMFGDSKTITRATSLPAKKSGLSPENTPPIYSRIKSQVKIDNVGLFQTKDNKISGYDQFFLDGKTNALKHSPQIPTSPSNSLVLLSMSARGLPQTQTPQGFAALSARGQAAVIDYAREAFAMKDKAPDAPDASALLKTLTTTKDDSFPVNENVELTVSNALNSASEEDRVQYFAAYLVVPPLPGRINGHTDPNREYARNFQACVIAAAPTQRVRQELLKTCADQALQSLMVWIESVDSLLTKPTTIAYGSLQNTASITPSVSIAPPGAPASGGVSGTLSSQRTENVTRQLDVRSSWLSPDRSMLRITQRGVEEATIAGSVVTTVVLHVPIAQMDAIEASDDADAAGLLKATDEYRLEGEPPLRCRHIRPTKIKLDEINEPIYREVDGLDEMVATARLARPGDWRKLWDRFKKEPDGLAFTSVSPPQVIRLWKNPRSVEILQIQDLLSAEARDPDSVVGDTRSILLAMWPSGSASGELAVAKEPAAYEGLVKALNDHRLGLEKTTGNNAGWYNVVDCASWDILSKAERDSALSRDRPGIGEVWLGEESPCGADVPIGVPDLGQLACQKFIRCAATPAQ